MPRRIGTNGSSTPRSHGYLATRLQGGATVWAPIGRHIARRSGAPPPRNSVHGLQRSPARVLRSPGGRNTDNLECATGTCGFQRPRSRFGHMQGFAGERTSDAGGVRRTGVPHPSRGTGLLAGSGRPLPLPTRWPCSWAMPGCWPTTTSQSPRKTRSPPCRGMLPPCPDPWPPARRKTQSWTNPQHSRR